VPHDPQPRTGRVALPQHAGRAPHWRVVIGPRSALPRSGRSAPVRGQRGPLRMDRETRVTAPPGAGAVSPEARASGAPDAQTAAAYRRAAGQRCWACNAPDSEPVRLQRRAGKRWVADATVQLCTACLAALHTPRRPSQCRRSPRAPLQRSSDPLGPPSSARARADGRGRPARSHRRSRSSRVPEPRGVTISSGVIAEARDHETIARPQSGVAH
jgi:hypothetical protein